MDKQDSELPTPVLTGVLDMRDCPGRGCMFQGVFKMGEVVYLEPVDEHVYFDFVHAR